LIQLATGWDAGKRCLPRNKILEKESNEAGQNVAAGRPYQSKQQAASAFVKHMVGAWPFIGHLMRKQVKTLPQETTQVQQEG